MRFKLNKAQPSIIRNQGQAKRGSSAGALGFHSLQNQFSLIRDNSMKKDNWNLFVGDNRYKTNFFLQFQDAFTKKLYQRNLIPSAVYSIRLMIIAMIIFDIVLIGYDSCATDGCFLKRLFVFILATLSMFGTMRKYGIKYSNRIRQLLIMILPMYWSFRVLQESNHPTEFLTVVSFFLPTFVMGLFILTDWIEYLAFSIVKAFTIGLLFFLKDAGEDFSIIAFFLTALKALVLLTFTYSLFEKVQKERFVIGFTNSKTKKILLALINQSPYPSAVVAKNGQIQFCNQQFESMLVQRLGMKQIPNSIFKLTDEDEENSAKLKQLIETTIIPPNLTNSSTGQQQNYGIQHSEKKGRAEIRLKKGSKTGKNKLSTEENKSSKEATENSAASETKSNVEKSQSQKILFEKYEMALVNADCVKYQSQKTALLTFNLVTEQKAKNKLLYLHSQLLYQFIKQFNKRLQQLYQKYQDKDDIQNQSIIEFLGTTYVALNKIQQIQHEFHDVNDSLKNPDENFLLKEEILQCVESLSVKCLSQQATLKLDANKCLPEKLAGDVTNFRLALQSAVEFATKYCLDGIIDLIVNFDGMTADQKYMISFDLSFNKNTQYNEEPIIYLLNNVSKNSKMSVEEILLQNYEEFFDLICNFGMGMIIFPSLILSLDGSYSITTIDSPKQERQEEQKQEEIKDQDQAYPLQANASKGKLKIHFKVPFNHAELSKKVLSPYFPFNPYKEDNNGKQIFKSPLLINRQLRNQALNVMRDLMEQNKTPTNKGNGILPQIKPFKNLGQEGFNFKSDGNSHAEVSNQASMPSEGYQRFDENNSFGRYGLGQELQIKDSNSQPQKKTDQNINRVQVKKVEQRLREFVQDNVDTSVEFFKNRPLNTVTDEQNPNLPKEQIPVKTSSKNAFNYSNQNEEAGGGEITPKLIGVQSEDSIGNDKNYFKDQIRQVATKHNSASFKQSQTLQTNNNKGLYKPSTFIKVNNLDDTSDFERSKTSMGVKTPNLGQSSSENIQQISFKQQQIGTEPMGDGSFKEIKLMPSFGYQIKEKSNQELLVEEEKEESPALLNLYTEGKENFDSESLNDECCSDKQYNDQPLSKHLQFDMMSSSGFGASKNLLRCFLQSPNSQNHSILNPNLYLTDDRNPRNWTEMQPSSNEYRVNNESDMKKPNISFFGKSKYNKQSLEEELDEEFKESFRMKSFPYKLGKQTQQYQQMIKQLDQQGQSDLNIWDHDLESRLNAERADYSLGNGSNSTKRLNHLGKIATTVDSSKRYILVVEDNQMISMILVESLKQMDIVAIVAENGIIAVDQFNHFMREGILFELILMDIIMPEMGGYEATQMIRKAETRFGLTEQEKHFICGFSAEVNPEIKKKCIISGMNDILSKPITTLTLTELVKRNKRQSNQIGIQNQMNSKNFLDLNDLTILPVRKQSSRGQFNTNRAQS